MHHSLICCHLGQGAQLLTVQHLQVEHLGTWWREGIHAGFLVAKGVCWLITAWAEIRNLYSFVLIPLENASFWRLFSESLSFGDDIDGDKYLQKDKYKDKDTQTKTNKTCFQDPMYAIFFKSRWFKDLEYYIDCLLGGHGHDEHGRGGLQCFRDQTICVSHSCTLSSFILLSSGWCLFYFICLTRQCPGASLSEGSFRLLANTSDSHQWSLWFPSQSSKAITCQNFNPPK